MLKIMIIETSGLGGIAHYAYNLCQALSSHTDVVLVTAADYELENYSRSFPVRKIFAKRHGYFKKVYSLLRAILREKPDILHFQSVFTARKDWLLFRVLDFMRFPVVLTAHNVFPHDAIEKTAAGINFSLRNIYHSCDAVISHHDKNRKELIDNFGVKENRIFVIPHGNYLFLADANGQDEKELCRKGRERLGLKKEDKVVLCFGAIREYKGIDYLITAFSEVICKIPDARLIIAGHSWEFMAKRYEKLIKDHGLEKFTLYRPEYIPIEDVPLYFHSADISVFPYLNTYGSGVMQLAYAFSLPVIATDAGIFSEMVENGKNGYVVPPRDTGALAGSIIRLLSCPEDIKRMGERSRRLAEEKYSWKEIAQKTAGVYKTIKRKEGTRR